MAEGGLTLLDGSQIRAALPTLEERAQRQFEELLQKNGSVNAPQFHAAALSESSELLARIPIPQPRFERAFAKLELPADESFHFDQSTFTSKFRDLLQFIADDLRDEPLVASVLDGVILKALLDDEDEFAMLAENLFTDLDADDSGKLSRKELRVALLQMGVEMGVPNPSTMPEADVLLSSILKKYEVEGNEELGQAQFAKLLQAILQELADLLASKPLVVILDVKVINGYQLRKVLADRQVLADVAKEIFEELDVSKDGKLSKPEIRCFFESRGSEWGLPSKEQSSISEQLFDAVFSIVDIDKNDFIDEAEFEVLVKGIFESFADQLEMNPIFLSN